MKKILIVHDCSGNKYQALKGTCDHWFGINNFEMRYFKHEEGPGDETPLSFEKLAKEASKRIAKLRTKFDPKTVSDETTIYYTTLVKGFMESANYQWLFTSYALFGTKDLLFPGMAESVPLKSEVSSSMDLPSIERYAQFTTLYSLNKTNSLIEQAAGINEIDWYKQALRNPIKIWLR